MRRVRLGLLIFAAVCLSVFSGCAGKMNEKEHSERETSAEEPGGPETATPDESEGTAEDPSRKDTDILLYLDENEVYLTIIKELTGQYGELRTASWLDEATDPYRNSKEVNGVCYLRLLDFDGDGDRELYAVCKNEEEDTYTGRVFSADHGRDPIFESPVNSELLFHTHAIELVCKGRDKYFVFVRYIPDGLGAQNINRLYGYGPDDPDAFSYARFTSFEESSDGDISYMISDDDSHGEWVSCDEDEYRKSEDDWWADAEEETFFCVRSSGGEIDLEGLRGSIRKTMQELTGKEGTKEETTQTEEAEDLIWQAEENPESEGERMRPFYGIWCGASKDEADAENIAASIREKGLPAQVFVTTDWSSLNKERWYVITAGTYDTQQEAEQALPEVRKVNSDAYIKYSGEYIR